MRRASRATSSPARTTSIPTCRRATRSASSTSRIAVGGSFAGVGITRAHLEEDAAKLIHTGDTGRIHGSGASLVDFNRGGTPLVEIVTEPDMRSAAEAREWAQLLRETIRQLGVSDVNMEEGSLRVDGNISIRPEGSSELGVKCELKNMNSFRFLERGIEAELARQRALLEAGEEVEQETLHFHPEDGSLTPLRSKEYAHDYRYFPEPDLVPVAPTEEMLKEAREALPELPAARRDRYVSEVGISEEAATTLAFQTAYAEFFERAMSAADGTSANASPNNIANWVTGELVATLREAGGEDDPLASKATPEAVAALAGLVESKAISHGSGKQVLAKLVAEGGDPAAIVEAEGLGQISDSGELEKVVDAAIESEPEAAEEVRDGNQKAIGRIMGAVMKQTQGRADGGAVQKLIKERLERKVGLVTMCYKRPVCGHTQVMAPNVVIAGGGFAGMTCARRLEKLLPKQSARLQLVNDVNFMLYTPFLPEAAAGLLEPRHVVTPLRDVLGRTYLRLGAICDHDPVARTVTLRTHEGESEELRYDELVIATGSVSRTLPIPGLDRHAIGFKSLADAIWLRNHVVETLELANSTEDPEHAERLLTYVFVGGGYAGLEALAELQDFAADAMDRYPRARLHGMRWILVEATDRVLPEIDAKLADYALTELRGSRNRGPTRHHARGGDGDQRQALDRRDRTHPDRGLDRRSHPAPEPGAAVAAARRERAGARGRAPARRGPGRRLGPRRLRRRPRAGRQTRARHRPARTPAGQGRRRERRRRAAGGGPSAIPLLEPHGVRQPRPLQGRGPGRRSYLLGLPRLVDGPDLPPEPDPGPVPQGASRDRLDREPALPAGHLRGRLDRPPAAASARGLRVGWQPSALGRRRASDRARVGPPPGRCIRRLAHVRWAHSTALRSPAYGPDRKRARLWCSRRARTGGPGVGVGRRVPSWAWTAPPTW